MKSPTENSLKLLREQGWTVQVTERWNPFAKCRQDLFGFCDILCMHESRGFLAVQATSYSNMNARLTKIKRERRALIFVAAGGAILIHGWQKVGGKWASKVKRYPEWRQV